MNEKEPTQRTDTGYEIPVPKRGDVEAVFQRSAQPVPAKSKRARRKRPSR